MPCDIPLLRGARDVTSGVFVFFICAAIVPGACFGQAQLPKRTDIYSIALIEAANEMEKQWGWIKASPLERSIDTDYKHLLVCIDESVRQQYPASADGRRFEFLSNAELRSRRKKIGKDFSALIISPATVQDGFIKVVVGQRVISVARGHLTFLISDWGNVYFRFDRDKNDIVFHRVELGGI
ncbi:MAG TPA: hypothetical protein VKE70_32400 [Candidatus Solibacter sp.]|nr:hypothetical protein [Candidatus Solibacter sp.]